MNTAIIFDIQRNSFVDGPGIRTTVFFKGCNLKCAWCHNPESQLSKPQVMFYKNKCTGCGRCKDIAENDAGFICYNDARKLCGKKYTVDKLFNEILKDKIFYENSGGGVTFSGGECMLQIDFLTEILKMCNENNINTAVDTAGYVPWDYFVKIIPYTDLFLYDIKAFDNDIHKKFTGVSNELILENLRKLFECNCNIHIRIPIVPTVNDSEAEINMIKIFLDSYRPQKVELLSYHKMGEHKYENLGIKQTKFYEPAKEQMKKLKEIFY